MNIRSHSGLILLLGVISICGCAPQSFLGSTKIGGTPPPQRSAQVRASYYGKGDGFAGKQTACGEIFDPQKLTAAHRTYPCGTKLRVTSGASGKSVVVRVNDRGPFIKGREIDLSYRAAREIGIVEQGEAAVRIEELTP
jgi:rare lipoprotein A